MTQSSKTNPEEKQLHRNGEDETVSTAASGSTNAPTELPLPESAPILENTAEGAKAIAATEADSQTAVPSGQSLFVMVGDISADRHTGKIIATLKQLKPSLTIFGCGGSKMQAAGMELLRNCEEFSLVGVVEGLKKLPAMFKLRDQMMAAIAERKPDAVMLVDYGTLNMRIAQNIRQKWPQMPILYFISPQVWGSRPGRIKVIARTITKMLVIFPFEEKIYLDRGISAKFVGHPLLTNMPSKEELMTREQFCQKFKLDPENPTIAIFIGSRRNEVSGFAGTMLDAVRRLHNEFPKMQFLFSAATEERGKTLEASVKKAKLEFLLDSHLRIIDSAHNWDTMNASDLVWAKSGSTTLETAMAGKPMLIFYKAMWVSYLLFCLFKRVKRVGWPNLLAGELLVPELLQLDCRAEQLVRYTRDLLDAPALRQEIADKLLTLRARLGQGDYATNVANEVIRAIDCNAAGNQTNNG
jgi:lipid-A-disaccharide synthase